MLNLNFVTPKRHFLARNCVIWAVVRQNRFCRFSCKGQQEKKRKGKEREGKEKHKKSRKRYISPISGKAPRKRIFIKFCVSGEMLNIIICANFGMEKLRGLGNTRCQILEFSIEMAGHPYNCAALPRSLWCYCCRAIHITVRRCTH